MLTDEHGHPLNIWERLEKVAIVKYDENFPTTATGVDDKTGRLVVVLGRRFLDGDYETRRYLVEHELAHIARGDVLLMDMFKGATDEETHNNQLRYNWAADACIHKHLLPVLGDGPLGPDGKPDGITLDGLREKFPDAGLEECDGSRAMPIYERLPNPDIEEQEMDGCGLTELLESGMEVNGNGLITKKIKVKGPLLTDEQRAALEQARAIASKMAGMSPLTIAPRRKPSPFKETTAERIVRQVASRVKATNGGVLKRVRSWARPGRLPIIPGTARRRAAKIMVACDVSGSMDPAHSAFNYLAGLEDVIWVAWASGAAVVPNSKEIHSAPVGGGTEIMPMLKIADQYRPDHLIIISDAYIMESDPPKPKMPVTWVIIGEKEPPWGVAIYTKDVS